MTIWLSSRQRSILGMISCSVADRLQHAGVGGEAGLAAALARQPELLEQDRAELLGRADDELLAGQVPDLALQAVRPPRARGRRPRRCAPCPGARPRSPSRAARATSGSSISVSSICSPRSEICSRCQAASACSSAASRAGVVGAVGAQAALLADLAERERAPRGLQQVGAQQRVVGEVRRHEARAPWRRGRRPGDRRARARRPRAARRARRARPRPTAAPKRHVGSAASSWPSGTSGGDHGDRRPPSPPGRACAGRRRVPSRRRTATVCSSTGSGAARPLASVRRAPPPGAAAARAARTRGRPRAGASGRARGRPRRSGRRRPAMSRGSSPARLDIRASSAWLVRFSLRLAPGDLVDRGEDRLEVAEALQQVRRGLVADARDAGDVVRRVALEAVEVGDQLGRDAVAVDHGLVVVDLRVGDAAPGRHHAHARLGVDDLEGVAVAGDDHHRHALLARLARRSRR